MYSKKIPFHDFKGNPQNIVVQFNLEVREVVKLMVEFYSVLKWLDSVKNEETRQLDTAEVVEFYNNLEKIMLEAYGKVSDDGLLFRKDGRYDFEDSKLFAACMEMFVSDPSEATKMLEELMPKNMEELVRKSEGNMDALKKDPQTSDEVRAQIARLEAQLAENTPSDS